MDELRNNPQIIRLLETLEENGMHKEKGVVSAIVSYIGDMEHTLSAMLAEMQEMRKEVNMIHNSSVKAKCENLIHTADSKIRQGIETVSKAKNNLISSAENAVKVFKEKGKEAYKNAINAMKIPETLDKLGKVFHSFAELEKYIPEAFSYQIFAPKSNHSGNVGINLVIDKRIDLDISRLTEIENVVFAIEE